MSLRISQQGETRGYYSRTSGSTGTNAERIYTALRTNVERIYTALRTVGESDQVEGATAERSEYLLQFSDPLEADEKAFKEAFGAYWGRSLETEEDLRELQDREPAFTRILLTKSLFEECD